jgi:hypothetical protein
MGGSMGGSLMTLYAIIPWIVFGRLFYREELSMSGLRVTLAIACQLFAFTALGQSPVSCSYDRDQKHSIDIDQMSPYRVEIEVVDKDGDHPLIGATVSVATGPKGDPVTCKFTTYADGPQRVWLRFPVAGMYRGFVSLAGFKGEPFFLMISPAGTTARLELKRN